MCILHVGRRSPKTAGPHPRGGGDSGDGRKMLSRVRSEVEAVRTGEDAVTAAEVVKGLQPGSSIRHLIPRQRLMRAETGKSRDELGH